MKAKYYRMRADRSDHLGRRCRVAVCAKPITSNTFNVSFWRRVNEPLIPAHERETHPRHVRQQINMSCHRSLGSSILDLILKLPEQPGNAQGVAGQLGRKSAGRKINLRT